jgi:GT2 family glycosyltransferase
VVVTRDRRDLLAGCLERLQGQHHPPDEIVVVDNQSSDGTADMVRERFPDVVLLSLAENVGGAGGFHAGMQAAHDLGHEWLWLMDDDSFPEPDALAALLDGDRRAPPGDPPLVLASQVRWKDGRLHPMNPPWFAWRRRAEMAEGIAAGLLLLRHTTFVSVLIRRAAVDRYGLPLAHYFIWTDDFEYTGRVLRENRGYLVPESVCLHWTPKPHSPVTGTGERFYYFVRNSLLLMRGSSLTTIERAHYARMAAGMTVEFLRNNRWDATARRTIVRGVRDGLRDAVR